MKSEILRRFDGSKDNNNNNNDNSINEDEVSSPGMPPGPSEIEDHSEGSIVRQDGSRHLGGGGDATKTTAAGPPLGGDGASVGSVGSSGRKRSNKKSSNKKKNSGSGSGGGNKKNALTQWMHRGSTGTSTGPQAPGSAASNASVASGASISSSVSTPARKDRSAGGGKDSSWQRREENHHGISPDVKGHGGDDDDDFDGGDGGSAKKSWWYSAAESATAAAKAGATSFMQKAATTVATTTETMTAAATATTVAVTSSSSTTTSEVTTTKIQQESNSRSDPQQQQQQQQQRQNLEQLMDHGTGSKHRGRDLETAFNNAVDSVLTFRGSEVHGPGTAAATSNADEEDKETQHGGSKTSISNWLPTDEVEKIGAIAASAIQQQQQQQQETAGGDDNANDEGAPHGTKDDQREIFGLKREGSHHEYKSHELERQGSHREFDRSPESKRDGHGATAVAAGKDAEGEGTDFNGVDPANLDAAMTYLHKMKGEFDHDPDHYARLDALHLAYMNGELGTRETIERATDLLSGHRGLMLGFSSYLSRPPSSSKTKIETDGTTASRDASMTTMDPMHLEAAMRYVHGMKDEFHHDEERYQRLDEIHRNFHDGKLTQKQAFDQVLDLLSEHPRLLVGFRYFLHHVPEDGNEKDADAMDDRETESKDIAAPSIDADHLKAAMRYLDRLKDEFVNDPEKRAGLDSLQRSHEGGVLGAKETFDRANALLSGHRGLLIGFRSFFAADRGQNTVEKAPAGRNHDDTALDPVDLEAAMRYIQRLKGEFVDDHENRAKLEGVHDAFDNGILGADEAIDQALVLLSDHPDLLLGFEYFLHLNASASESDGANGGGENNEHDRDKEIKQREGVGTTGEAAGDASANLDVDDLLDDLLDGSSRGDSRGEKLSADGNQADTAAVNASTKIVEEPPPASGEESSPPEPEEDVHEDEDDLLLDDLLDDTEPRDETEDNDEANGAGAQVSTAVTFVGDIDESFEANPPKSAPGSSEGTSSDRAGKAQDVWSVDVPLLKTPDDTAAAALLKRAENDAEETVVFETGSSVTNRGRRPEAKAAKKTVPSRDSTAKPPRNPPQQRGRETKPRQQPRASETRSKPTNIKSKPKSAPVVSSYSRARSGPRTKSVDRYPGKGRGTKGASGGDSVRSVRSTASSTRSGASTSSAAFIRLTTPRSQSAGRSRTYEEPKPILTKWKPRGPTIPKSPRLETTERHRKKYGTDGPDIWKQELALACSTTWLASNLRQNEEDTRPRPQHPAPTVPKSPKFHKLTVRTLPQSFDEKEKEMMEFFESRPFKASPLPKSHTSPSTPGRVRSRGVTTVQPFSLTPSSRSTSQKASPKKTGFH